MFRDRCRTDCLYQRHSTIFALTASRAKSGQFTYHLMLAPFSIPNLITLPLSTLTLSLSLLLPSPCFFFFHFLYSTPSVLRYHHSRAESAIRQHHASGEGGRCSPVVGLASAPPLPLHTQVRMEHRCISVGLSPKQEGRNKVLLAVFISLHV